MLSKKTKKTISETSGTRQVPFETIQFTGDNHNSIIEFIEKHNTLSYLTISFYRYRINRLIFQCESRGEREFPKFSLNINDWIIAEKTNDSRWYKELKKLPTTNFKKTTHNF